MAIFRFFKMADAAILDFSNFKMAELRRLPNLVQIRPNATEI